MDKLHSLKHLNSAEDKFPLLLVKFKFWWARIVLAGPVGRVMSTLEVSFWRSLERRGRCSIAKRVMSWQRLARNVKISWELFVWRFVFRKCKYCFIFLLTKKVFYKCFVCSDRWLIPSDFVLVSAAIGEISSSTQNIKSWDWRRTGVLCLQTRSVLEEREGSLYKCFIVGAMQVPCVSL